MLLRHSFPVLSGILFLGFLSSCEKNDRTQRDEEFRKSRQIAQLSAEVNRLKSQQLEKQGAIQSSPALAVRAPQDPGMPDQRREFADAAPSLTPMERVGRMVKPSEFLNSEEALTIAEVATMVRARVPQAEFIQTLKGRGLVNAIEGNDADALARMGATPTILAELSNYDNVLTPSEYGRYCFRQSQHSNDKAALRSSLREQEAAREWNESVENARLERLSQQQRYNASQDKAEQDRQRAATAWKLERESREADWKNSNHDTYGRTWYPYRSY